MPSMISKLLTAVMVTLVLSSGPMMAAPKKLVHPKEFPKGRPFSPGLMVGDTLYVAGQTGQDLKTAAISDDFETEVKQTLDNIGLVLKEAGLDFDHVVSVNVYLTDMELFPADERGLPYVHEGAASGADHRGRGQTGGQGQD